VAPSTYYAAKTRPPSARACRDAELIPQLVVLWEDNYRVYGARKLWKAAHRAGLDIGRDQVARLMHRAGIKGARRTKRVRTTRADPVAVRHPDLVQRRFRADAPNQLWVTDLTFVPSWAGVLRGGVVGRDDDLPGLHPANLTGQRDHGPALDTAGFEPQSRIALRRRPDEIIQRHPVRVRQREQQLQGGPPLPGFQPRQRALRDPRRLGNTAQRHAALGADALEPGPDLLERGGDSRRGGVFHEAI